MRSPLRVLRRRVLGPPPRPAKVQRPRRVGKAPPEVPEGWTIGPPHFIGIGVQKAGTTWWWTLLAAHPDMVSRIKETYHLGRLGWRPLGDADRRSYHRYFPRREGVVTGEWTPRYMAMPGMTETILACAPEARLLALVRDPIERFRSGINQWAASKQRFGNPLDLPRGAQDAFARSFYGFQLQRFVEAFGRDRLLVLQLERCRQDPAGEYRRTLDFVGLRPWDPPASLLEEHVHVTRTPKAELRDEERATLVAAYEEDVRLLRALVPDLDLRLWPDFAHLAGEQDR